MSRVRSAEKIVKLTPSKYDDILVDVIWGAIRKAAGRDEDKQAA